MQDLIPFESWLDVVAFARRRRSSPALWYGAPLDLARAYPYRRISVVRVLADNRILIDPMSNQADNFTADAGHLLRFRRLRFRRSSR